MRTSYFCLWFLYILVFSPNLSGRRLDVYHTSTQWCGPSANLECRPETWARWKCRTQKIAKKSPSGHHRTTLSGYVFATKAHIDNRKNLLSSNISSTCSHDMVNFCPLAAEIGPVVWGTPANFKGFCVLAALLHGTVVVGVSQTLRRWKDGTTVTCIRQGGHHVGHWLTFLVMYIMKVITRLYFVLVVYVS